MKLDLLGSFFTEDKVAYQERINQPIKVVREAPTIDSKTLTIKNFSFQMTGSWSGQFTFDYAFSPEVPIAREAYQFVLSGMGKILYCEFKSAGPVITELEGTYVIDVDLRTALHEANGINCPDNLNKYASLTYEEVELSLKDTSATSELIYHHTIDVAIKLYK